ncbi:protein translocase subunit SecF [Patescibacteria group bacterium]|nr:protein translocase subunit SecF [Patescibacteria group bacterium]MBU1683612.1 protein translocase subunit SecF [Patescibacteria group bacterium]
MKFKFIKYTKVWFAFSIIAVLISIGAMVYNKTTYGNALELGIDFTGGSLMEFQFESETDSSSLYEVIEAAYPDSVSQITATGEGTYIVHAKDMTEEQLDSVNASVSESLGGFEMLRFTTIGPKIGDTLKRKAIIALSVALIAIVLYIAYAFRKVPKRVSPWKFGLCAIVALAHDVLITLGIFALLRFEIDAFFITALLTIMGFSVHDTIVVFDRIRENLKKQARDDTFGDVADISLNQTLTRSINTSISTLFPLMALYVWGAESIRVLIFALIIGIFVGTYSSIFIASPLLTMWQERTRIR